MAPLVQLDEYGYNDVMVPSALGKDFIDWFEVRKGKIGKGALPLLQVSTTVIFSSTDSDFPPGRLCCCKVVGKEEEGRGGHLLKS